MTLSTNSVIFINVAVVLLLVISFIIGYSKGFIWQLVKTLGILVVILFSWILSPGLSKLISIFPRKYAPFNGTELADVFYDKINSLCWFLIVLVVGLIILAIVKPLFKVITEIPIIKQVNKVIGAILSIIPSCIIIMLATYVLNTAIFTNGKEIVNGSLLRYTDVVVNKISTVLNDSFAENQAIQKMLSDPLSLDSEDIANIIKWLERSKVSSDDIYQFLLKYGIDTNVLNDLINSGE